MLDEQLRSATFRKWAIRAIIRLHSNWVFQQNSAFFFYKERAYLQINAFIKQYITAFFRSDHCRNWHGNVSQSYNKNVKRAPIKLSIFMYIILPWSDRILKILRTTELSEWIPQTPSVSFNFLRLDRITTSHSNWL